MKLVEKLSGALYGVAIGDAMGAPVEGMPCDAALAKHSGHDFRKFIPPRHGGDPRAGKGNGRITDDTLMTEVLIKAYGDAMSHLDAYGYRKFILPHVKDRSVWIPEWQREGILFDRLWHPEKYPWMRMVPANAEPRTAGIGNMVNCGIAMWMMPAGAVNAGDPEGAYQEAVLMGSAHNESFAVEAGGVMAACYAEAMSAKSSVDSVIEAALDLAKDGTGRAIRVCCEAADPSDELGIFVARVRAAMAPYDQREGHVPDDEPLALDAAGDVGRPSRIASIEELPVALAALKYGAGDPIKTLRAGVCYGRDCDSIAGMALGVFGALFGAGGLPQSLKKGVDKANRRNFSALARSFDRTVRRIALGDRKRWTRRASAIR